MHATFAVLAFQTVWSSKHHSCCFRKVARIADVKLCSRVVSWVAYFSLVCRHLPRRSRRTISQNVLCWFYDTSKRCACLVRT